MSHPIYEPTQLILLGASVIRDLLVHGVLASKHQLASELHFELSRVLNPSAKFSQAEQDDTNLLQIDPR